MNAPEPRGEEIEIHMFMGSDHAGDKLSHRSRSSFLIYVNTTLVQGFFKKQSTVETSVFGTEFVAIE